MASLIGCPPAISNTIATVIFRHCAVGSGSGADYVRAPDASGNFTIGVNDVFVGTGAGNAGWNSTSGANTIGANYATVLSSTTNPTEGSGTNFVSDNGAFGTNFVFVGAGSTDTGNNTVGFESSLFGSNFVFAGANSTNVGNNGTTETNGGFNLVFAGGDNTDVGNNTGGGINIAIELPGVSDVGNCSAALCVNLFGMQLI